MAETLLAILLVTSSVGNSTVSFRWPSKPKASPRLVRQKPIIDLNRHGDATWWASHCDSPIPEDIDEELLFKEEGFQCEWRRPGTRSSRKSASRHRHEDNSQPVSGRTSSEPLYEEDFSEFEDKVVPEFNEILSFTSKQLGRMLTPGKRSLYQQKFELVVDDLVFIGHPVCKDEDGVWRLKSDTGSPPVPVPQLERGRDSRMKTSVARANGHHVQEAPEEKKYSLLNSFHLVLVLDHPDPSSTSYGNLSKYFDQLYEHISLPVTTLLLQEQVSSDLVEKECKYLNQLEEEYIMENHSYEAYISVAQTGSYCVRAMQSLYAAIKSSSIAHICLSPTGPSFEVQLPPYLDSMLYTETDEHSAFTDQVGFFESEKDSYGWGSEMEVGWYLPVLAPWKALLLMDDDHRSILDCLERRSVNRAACRGISNSTIAFLENQDRFLKEVRITRSLKELSERLDWPLETHVYPFTRWLVSHRRAKLVDVVHRSLKNVFTPTSKLSAPLSDLISEYETCFDKKGLPSLPEVLSRLTVELTDIEQQDDASQVDFCSIFIHSRDEIHTYYELLVWLLRRDLVRRLHLRVRIVVSKEIKQQVYEEVRLNAEEGTSSRRKLGSSSVSPQYSGLSQSRTGAVVPEDEVIHDLEESSILFDPGQASGLERRWLRKMGEGVDATAVSLFEHIFPYFDGKTTDDEILFKSEITRKQFRHVLRSYEQHLLTFLHP